MEGTEGTTVVGAAGGPATPERRCGLALLVEPDDRLREGLARALAEEGLAHLATADPAEAIASAAGADRVDLLVAPFDPLRSEDRTFLEAFRFHHPLSSVIVTVAGDPGPAALAAMQAGATDLVAREGLEGAPLVQAIRTGCNRARALHQMTMALPEVNKAREENRQLTRQVEQLQETLDSQAGTFEESQEVFYLDLSRMMSIIDSILDGIIFTDRDARITLINPSAERLLGVNGFLAIGQQISDLDGVDELLQVIADDQGRVIEVDTVFSTVEVPGHDQDLDYFKVTTTAVTDYRGNFSGLLTVLQDVTAEFKADQLKNQYLSIVSHELRTPLTGIKTFITMMAKGALGAVSDQQERVLDTLKEQTLRLEHQIDKLISLGMLEQEEFAQDFEVFSVHDILQPALASFESEAQDRGVTLVTQLPPGIKGVYLEADRQNIKRVIQVLLENAVKFNRPGGKVIVSVVVGPEEILFRVKDTGIGIDPRYQKRVFEKFFQVEDPLTRQYGGAGLGLTVAERVLRAHGSRLVLDSALGSGATFQFSLPRYRTEPNRPDEDIVAGEARGLPERSEG